MRTAIRLLVLSATLAAVSSGAVYGGWAVTTVDDFPDHAVAGRPLTLTWMVRQHGHTVLTDLRGSVEAVSGRQRFEIPAGRSGGRYSATLTFPSEGEWTIAIRHGFGGETRALPTLRVVAATQPTPAAISEVTRGQRLFVTKGCITCHGEIKAGPELAGRRFDNAWLAKFLAKPARSQALPRNEAPMPDLGLLPREVAALVAFVNAPQQSAQR
jgi:mono/diheme cytochrome c family protein